MRNLTKTEHHLYPRNAVDASGTNNPINKIILPDITHTNWHRVFGNLEFHYQILRVLEINCQIVQRDTLRAVADIVKQDPKYIYENGVFKPRY